MPCSVCERAQAAWAGILASCILPLAADLSCILPQICVFGAEPCVCHRLTTAACFEHVWRVAGQQAEDGGAVRGEPEFIGAAGTGAQDTPAAYATRQDAQRLLNQKHVHEIEAALEEALRKADALWSEMQEEQRLNGSLRQLVVKLRTSKLEVEDRIEECASLPAPAAPSCFLPLPTPPLFLLPRLNRD